MASPLLDRILSDIKTAMKNKESEALLALRTLHSDVKNTAINAKEEISDSMVVDAIVKNIKQKKEAMEMFQRAAKQELVDNADKAVQFLEKYLPEPLTEEEVLKMVEAAKEKIGASAKDMGKMMKELAPKIKGRFDTKRLNDLIQKVLNS
ncbi:MAG: GatB/YqeY domain-containing protein [Fibrobacter sp.]|jgi:uncharacterized protein YqeY|nr:GatB/YqeY domain-containing protein [Fibrobacter sp.]